MVREWISDLEDGMAEITAAKQNIKRRTKKKKKDSLKDPWDNLKHTICIIEVSEGEERERKDSGKYLKR